MGCFRWSAKFGLAIGVAFAGADAAHAHALTTGIALQDVPEGLVVALALRSVGYGRAFAVALVAASGLLEPVAAVLGALALTVAAGLLPWGWPSPPARCATPSARRPFPGPTSRATRGRPRSGWCWASC